MNVARMLERAALHAPGHTAVFHGAEPLWSYAQLRDRVASLAALLTARGVGPGRQVALFLSNAPAYLETMYAVWWAGATVVPVNAKLHPRELGYILDDAGTSLVVTDEAHLPAVEQARGGDGDRPEVLVAGRQEYAEATATPSPDQDCAPAGVTDIAWLFYTSGTTGRPKGVALAHRQLMAMALSYHAEVDAVGPDEKTLYAAPMSHGAGLYSLVFMLHGSGHVFPPSGGFDAAETCSLAAALGNVSMFAAPTMVNRMVDHLAGSGPGGDHGFRTVVYGGGPMYVADLVRAREVLGDRLAQIYGQGESPMTITTLAKDVIADDEHPRWRERAASVGRPFAMCDVAVVDSGGTPLPPGSTGEVVVRGDTVMVGYWNNPEATAATIRDGWLWTGDLGTVDEDGYLTLKDRSKDVVISGGANVYPREVEEVLLQHPGVAEVSVIGVPDREWGETVAACVVLSDEGVRVEDLDAFCKEHMAGFKRPRRYWFLDALPKNSTGKILKTELRATYAGDPV